MKRLAQRIATDLEKSKISAVYNSELARVWPTSMPSKERQKRIRQFAKAHGLNVNIFEIGLCAIFERPGSNKSKHRSKAWDKLD